VVNSSSARWARISLTDHFVGPGRAESVPSGTPSTSSARRRGALVASRWGLCPRYKQAIEIGSPLCRASVDSNSRFVSIGNAPVDCSARAPSNTMTPYT
jgi:hypothetical protein